MSTPSLLAEPTPLPLATAESVLARLRVDMEDRGGRLEMLLPYATLEPIRDVLYSTIQGDAGEPGAPRGDLHVVIKEREHKIFQRSGSDLMTEVPCSFGQLALGDTVELPTLRGKAEMTIPAGTQSGKVFRLRGQGLPQLEGRARGDQLVRVFVQTPKDLSERQKQLLREFEKLEQERTGKKTFFEKLADYFA